MVVPTTSDRHQTSNASSKTPQHHTFWPTQLVLLEPQEGVDHKSLNLPEVSAEDAGEKAALCLSDFDPFRIFHFGEKRFLHPTH